MFFSSSLPGMSQELKEMKRKLESTEEELEKLKKSSKEEIDQVHQHYSQRVSLADFATAHHSAAAA